MHSHCAGHAQLLCMAGQALHSNCAGQARNEPAKMSDEKTTGGPSTDSGFTLRALVWKHLVDLPLYLENTVVGSSRI